MGFNRRGPPEEHPRARRIHQAARIHGVRGKHIHAGGPERGEGGTARPRLGPWIAYTTFILLARNIFEGEWRVPWRGALTSIRTRSSTSMWAHRLGSMYGAGALFVQVPPLRCH